MVATSFYKLSMTHFSATIWMILTSDLTPLLSNMFLSWNNVPLSPDDVPLYNKLNVSCNYKGKNILCKIYPSTFVFGFNYIYFYLTNFKPHYMYIYMQHWSYLMSVSSITSNSVVLISLSCTLIHFTKAS